LKSADASSDFDMDELDDDGMLDMIDDLETDRPVIHESPSSFGFARASNPQQLMTPIRSNMANGGSAPSSAASANAGMHGSGGHSVAEAAGIANPAPRNLNTQLVSANQQQQQQQQQTMQAQSNSSSGARQTGTSSNGSDAAMAAERPRSFADITSFVPTSQSSSAKSGVSRQLSISDNDAESAAKR
ncbi:hypothetical protein FB639_006196, partial [Coemansia asiatica]